MEHTWIKIEDWKELPKNISGLYRITCPCNKVYIGQSGSSIYTRWWTYSSLKPIKQKFLYKELNKCKVFENWTFEYFEYSMEKCKEMEIFLIKYYNTFFYENRKFGLNGTRGGDGTIGVIPSQETIEKRKKTRDGYTHSLETRKKISEGNLGKKQSQETLSKLSAIRKGKPSWNKGKKATPEQIEKNRLGHLGKKQSQETKDKRLATKIKNGTTGKGRKHTQEQIEKHRMKMIGRTPWNKGISPKPESVEKQRQKMLGRKLSLESIAKREATKKANREKKLLGAANV